MGSPAPEKKPQHPPSHGGGPTDPAHDENLRRGILPTKISRPVAIALVSVFLLLIYGIPLGQAVKEKLDDDDSSVLPIFTRAPTKENLRQFEKELEDAS